MKKIIHFSFKHWRWIVSLSSILTLISVYFILDIKIDNSMETLTIDNDPQLLLLQQMEAEYGGNEFVVIAFKGNDIFTPRALSMIQDLTREIEKVDNVEKVLSLTNAYTIKESADGFGTYPLLSGNDLRVQDMNALKNDVMSNRMYRRWLYSDDGNATAVIAWIAPVGKNDAARWQVVTDIRKIIDREKGHRQFHVYGMPVYQKLIFDAMLSDQFILTVILSILVGGVLFYIFRDIRLVFIPFILISLTGLWALGFMVMSGSTLNFATFIIPIVVLIVSLCDSVHIMSHYREINGRYTNRQDALKDVISHIGPPVMLTSITTAVGFLSLAASSIKPVRDFGIFTGLGVIFAFGVSITLLPMIMSVLNLKKTTSVENKSFTAMEKGLARIGTWIPGHKGIILFFTGIIVIISITGVTRIQTRQDIIDTLKENKALDDARKFIDVDMAGSCEFNALFKGDHEYAVLEPENLKLMETIQNRLVNEVPEVLKCISVIDMLKLMNQAMNGNDPAFYKIPATREEAIDYMEIYGSDEDKADLDSLVTSDFSLARIRMFTTSADDSIIARKAFDRCEEIIFDSAKGSGITVGFTGRPKVFLNMVDSLVSGMVKSFSYAFLAILVMMMVIFRSPKIGLISTIVNIIPAILTFGIMGWLDIPLNMLTAMVPSIAIGIAVDDTIHFIWRFEKEIRYDGDYPNAVIRTMKSVGKPIITTSVLICTGFAIFYFSKLTLLTEFGFLTLTTVIGALLADLFTAPALLLLFRPIRHKQDEDEMSPSYQV